VATQAATRVEQNACSIRGLTVVYRVERHEYAAVQDVDLDIPSGEITAVIGESGSGKTTLAMAMLNAVQPPGRIAAGSVVYPTAGDILRLSGKRLRRLRGDSISMVFQTSQNSLNPLKRIGGQAMDLARSHGRDPRGTLREARDLCAKMSLDADRVLTSYQHELSGGMRQRVGIMLALVLQPEVVLLDEPTTALDVLSQSEVLQILRDLQRERRFSAVLITHDMGVVAELADRVAVMYAGRIVERGRTRDVLIRPDHPYTRALIRSIPRLSGDLSEAVPLPGLPPSLTTIPDHGCVFRARCAYRMPICDTVQPPLESVGPDHDSACYLEGFPSD